MIVNQILLERAVALAFKNTPSNLGASLRKRRRNALVKAFRNLLENPFIHYENGKLLILSNSVTETGAAKFYETSRTQCRLVEPGNFLCHAFWNGFPCWHRAAFEIVENYLSLTGGESLQNHAETVHDVNSSVAAVNSKRRF